MESVEALVRRALLSLAARRRVDGPEAETVTPRPNPSIAPPSSRDGGEH